MMNAVRISHLEYRFSPRAKCNCFSAWTSSKIRYKIFQLHAAGMISAKLDDLMLTAIINGAHAARDRVDLRAAAISSLSPHGLLSRNNYLKCLMPAITRGRCVWLAKIF